MRAPVFVIVVLTVIFSQSKGFSEVIDGGIYAPHKVTTHTDQGSDHEITPDNFSFEEERQNYAPVGKSIYVLGEDGKCYWGNFSYTKFDKALFIYTKSPVTGDHCIYQKTLSEKAQGFSISARSGGICVPTYGVSQEKAGGPAIWVVRESGSTASMADCVQHTVSFGEQSDSVKKSVVVEAAPAKADTSEMAPRGPTTADLIRTIEPAHMVHAPMEHAPKLETVVEASIPETKAEMKTEAAGDSSYYTVQLSSYLSSQEATEKIEALQRVGVNAFQSIATVEGVLRYRVCSGHFENMVAAKRMRKNISVMAAEPHAFVQVVKAQNVSSARHTASD